VIGQINARLAGDEQTFTIPDEVDLFIEWAKRQREYTDNTTIFDKSRMWVMAHLHHLSNTDGIDPYSERMSVELTWVEGRVSVEHFFDENDRRWFDDEEATTE
jgi:hypothetical protein